jgi:UDP-3-O-[3-hydroxymyristoyl] N-acetylglucosamine deacetylase
MVMVLAVSDCTTPPQGSANWMEITSVSDTSSIVPPQATPSTLSTTIGWEDNSIATIEHLMAAFAGLGIDNALVEVSGREVPVLDGSAAPFVDKLCEVGVQLQTRKRKLFMPSSGFTLTIGQQKIKYEPYHPLSEAGLGENPRLEINCSIDFPASQAIGCQTYHMEFNHRTFMDIYDCRTFCHIDEVNHMRSKGLALGGSLDNAVVVNNHAVINNEGLRYPNEFVKHKLLDFIGDLSLIGGRLVGKVNIYKGGHTLHAAFTKRILQECEQAEERASCVTSGVSLG